MAKSIEEIRTELREAYWAKKFATEAYDEALKAYRATDPAPGSVDHDDIKITRTKDTVRKTFNKEKMIGVYGKAEYDRFVEEKPQEGSIRIVPITTDEDGEF